MSAILHTMLRVGDLEKSLGFYTGMLGMRLLRREAYPEGRFTLAFVGYRDEQSVIELTHNWDVNRYEKGTAYGHIALSVQDIYAACAALEAKGVRLVRKPGAMAHAPADGGDPDIIAFIEDPDGYRIELIQRC
ncbi:MAG: lactoylglutathione lyase [Burkholderiales bacterium]|nr:lactoylglutathione lyase [Burkholderiales bacterium]